MHAHCEHMNEFTLMHTVSTTLRWQFRFSQRCILSFSVQQCAWKSCGPISIHLRASVTCQHGAQVMLPAAAERRNHGCALSGRCIARPSVHMPTVFPCVAGSTPMPADHGCNRNVKHAILYSPITLPLYRALTACCDEGTHMLPMLRLIGIGSCRSSQDCHQI